MEERVLKIEKEIVAIKERNLRVEADKAWETSNFRIFSIVCVTYIIASFILYFAGVNNFLLSALVATAGYFLSMQSLPIIKRWWVTKFFPKNK
jgi:hypothetical protein